MYKIKKLEWKEGAGNWYTFPIIAASISLDEFSYYKVIVYRHQNPFKTFDDLDKAKTWAEEQHAEYVRQYLEPV